MVVILLMASHTEAPQTKRFATHLPLDHQATMRLGFSSWWSALHSLASKRVIGWVASWNGRVPEPITRSGATGPGVWTFFYSTTANYSHGSTSLIDVSDDPIPGHLTPPVTTVNECVHTRSWPMLLDGIPVRLRDHIVRCEQRTK